jgi:hypothetical protein
LEARFVIQEGGELQRARLVELGVKRVAVNELRVWPFDPDLNSLARHDRGGEGFSRTQVSNIVLDGLMAYCPKKVGGMPLP